MPSKRKKEQEEYEEYIREVAELTTQSAELYVVVQSVIDGKFNKR
jgi:hypothetical protein